jgi:hypothetical protein
MPSITAHTDYFGDLAPPTSATETTTPALRQINLPSSPDDSDDSEIRHQVMIFSGPLISDDLYISTAI